MAIDYKATASGDPIPRVPEGSTNEKGLLHNSKNVIEVPGGTGTLQPLQGFIDYNDTTGDVSLVADTWTIIPNNGAGPFSNDTYAPHNVTELMNVATGAIDTTELELGDTIIIRNDFTINI